MRAKYTPRTNLAVYARGYFALPGAESCSDTASKYQDLSLAGLFSIAPTINECREEGDSYAEAFIYTDDEAP